MPLFFSLQIEVINIVGAFLDVIFKALIVLITPHHQYYKLQIEEPNSFLLPKQSV